MKKDKSMCYSKQVGRKPKSDPAVHLCRKCQIYGSVKRIGAKGEVQIYQSCTIFPTNKSRKNRQSDHRLLYTPNEFLSSISDDREQLQSDGNGNQS